LNNENHAFYDLFSMMKQGGINCLRPADSTYSQQQDAICSIKYCKLDASRLQAGHRACTPIFGRKTCRQANTPARIQVSMNERDDAIRAI
jgi:hypothetical protein